MNYNLIRFYSGDHYGYVVIEKKDLTPDDLKIEFDKIAEECFHRDDLLSVFNEDYKVFFNNIKIHITRYVNDCIDYMWVYNITKLEQYYDEMYKTDNYYCYDN